MEDRKELTIEENDTEPAEKKELTDEEKKEKVEEFKASILSQLEERKAKVREAEEVMMKGRGVLTLETPISSGGKEIDKLTYDFTDLTGMEYIDALDSDTNANNSFKITNRQALALFATAAAKQTDGLDMRDIMERIGVTDAVEGVHLATLFFRASSNAGRMRLSKMS